MEPGAARHGPSSNPMPGSPGEQLVNSSPTNKITGPPPAALYPQHQLMGWTWKDHCDADAELRRDSGLKLTWPIKALLCRSVLGGVWTCWVRSRQVGLVCQCCSWW